VAAFDSADHTSCVCEQGVPPGFVGLGHADIDSDKGRPRLFLFYAPEIREAFPEGSGVSDSGIADDGHRSAFFRYSQQVMPMPIIPQASSAAGRVDSVFLFILVLCVAFLVLITATLIYFVIKYNRKRHPKGKDIEGNKWLELAWTGIPTVLFLVMFFYGWTNFNYMREVPRDAMVIGVTARQWAWSFTYPNGKRTSELVLAYNKPVKLELRSLDVIHGFFIPAFRIKEDVVPGKENYTWFAPTQFGSFDIECTAICGIGHATMLAKAVVIPVSDFEKWYAGNESAPISEQAKTPEPANDILASPALSILNQKLCTTCHSVDGTASVGPTLKGLYGKRQTVIDSNGKEREVTADDAYLRRAIEEPDAEDVKGYPPVMPPTPMTEAELNQIVGFIRILK
jgi:cytochrome c oxidase subunit 2